MTKAARARMKAGRSSDVTLKPKSRFAAGLATAKRVLVREKLTINGSVETLLRRLLDPAAAGLRSASRSR